MTRAERGFTLIEMMLVIGIIAIVAAMAIPNLFEARKSANEASAIASLKTIATVQALFREADKDKDGSVDYGSMAELATAGLVDSTLASGVKAGYAFECGPAWDSLDTQETMFWSVANPVIMDGTGNRAYCSNVQGVIYYTQQILVGGTDLDNLKRFGTIPPAVNPVR